MAKHLNEYEIFQVTIDDFIQYFRGIVAMLEILLLENKMKKQMNEMLGVCYVTEENFN